MIARAIAADVPFAWVAADSVYGVGDVEQRYAKLERVMSSALAPTITLAPG